MLTYRLGIDDLARVRLGYTPITETSLSLWTLVLGPQNSTHLTTWYRHARAVEGSYDSKLIRALVSPSRSRIPDFITPLPAGRRQTVEEECERIAMSDPSAVLHDLVRLTEGSAPSPALARVMERPENAARTIADALRGYHDAAVAPFWSAISRVLESDVTFRGREFAQHGAAGLFDGLGDAVRWVSTGGVEVRLTYCGGGDGSPDERGLVLTPSVFTRNASAIWDPAPSGHAWLSYPARGRGALAEDHVHPDRDAALAELIGGVKAAILLALTEPTSTSTLAERFSVTPSAVSQHVRVLRANGLIDSSRHGRTVLHRLSPLGRQMTPDNDGHR